MIRITIFSFLLFISTALRADYARLSLAELIRISEYAVMGEIIELDSNYFTLRIDSVLLGNYENDFVKILRFRDWTCAQRYKNYELGQKEIVFFGKSNQVTDTYDYIGYGAGNEFEIPIIKDTVIYYNKVYRIEKHSLYDFTSSIEDYHESKDTIYSLILSSSFDSELITSFASKSTMHANLIEESKRFRKPKEPKPVIASITNLETNFLYESYDNKVQVISQGNSFDDLILEVKDAKVTKQRDYYIVNPQGGWTKRWLILKKVDENGDTIKIDNVLCNVYPIPEPAVFITEYFGDTIPPKYLMYARPRVAYIPSGKYSNDDLKYEVLSYNLDIIHNDTITDFKLKSTYLINEMRDALYKLQQGDILKFYDIKVLYPDGKIKYVSDMTIFVDKDD